MLLVQSTEFRGALSELTDVATSLLEYIVGMGKEVYQVTSGHVKEGA
jgi:hypothetical protein